MSKPITKQGAYGTLYRYAIRYTDSVDGGCGEMTWYTWAYNLEHAEDKFFENDEGWRILSLARVTQGLDQHRAIRHIPGKAS